MVENPLKQYFYSNTKRKLFKWVHYLDVYHKHFQRFIGTECVVLEIGVAFGGSLQMWKHYFGNKAKIYGIDIYPGNKFEEENIEVFIGSQNDVNFIHDVISKIPKIDILIDDGSHFAGDQIISFNELFDHINDKGIYVCEDLHTSYWPEYGGGLNNSSSFIEFSKTLIDRLNAWHIKDDKLSISKFTSDVSSLHFYDSMFILEKTARDKPTCEEH